jgi:hypothetical protein
MNSIELQVNQLQNQKPSDLNRDQLINNFYIFKDKNTAIF